MSSTTQRIIVRLSVIAVVAVVLFGIYPPIQRALASGPQQLIPIDATTCKTITGGPELFPSSHAFVAAGTVAEWRLRCPMDFVEGTFHGSSAVTITGLKAFARRRHLPDCEADRQRQDLRVELYRRLIHTDAVPRNSVGQCSLDWNTAGWQTCQVNLSVADVANPTYVEFFAPIGVCWEISGAEVYYEPLP